MKIRMLLYIFLLALVTIFMGCGGGTQATPSDPGSGELLTNNDAIPKDFIRRQGAQLVVGTSDQTIELQGVCFGNNVWSNLSLPPTTHHNETDFQRVQDMHMNAIRFYLNYQLFEDDANPYHYKQTGWDWLDQNITWAKNHNIYLILNIHVPQGGYQSNGDGMALWDIPENQNRLTALWRAIADHCKNESTVAAYDLLNEPVVSSSMDQWRNLALRLAGAIRGVDRNHLMIVERLNGVKGQWNTYSQLNFFLVNDSNTMYTFHFYSPIEYSHQNTPWTNIPPDGSYPDESIIMVPSDATWYTATFNNPTIPAGSSGWTYYNGVDFHVTDSKILVGKPAFVGKNAGSTGDVYFDDFVIKEFDENHNFIRDIYTVNVAANNGWSFWSNNNVGTCSLSSIGHTDSASIKISGTTDDANASNNNYRFVVTTGHYYRISGWIKGDNISSGSACQMRIDFETSPSGGQVYPRNKDYLASILNQYLQWGQTNNVPMYIGEFGLYKDCFNTGKGGLNWVGDMIDLLKSHGVNFTYHAYHESAFGIYRNDSGLPDPAQANQGLIDLFSSKL